MDLNHGFLGEEAAGTGPAAARVITAPVELSTSYMKGTAAAPAAILEASRQIELYNPSVGVDLEGAGIVTVEPGASSRESLVSFLEENRGMLKECFHVFLGGEHSITPWILEAMDYGEIGIVWIDAHADLRPEYLGDPESHACAARNSLDYGDIVEIGVRSFSSAEMEFMEGERRVEVHQRWGQDAIDSIGRLPGRVYISLDYDGIDPSVIRAVGTPEPGGLTWETLMEVFDHLFFEKEVVGMDAVELCPSGSDEASSFIAAKAVYEAVSRAIARGVRKDG